MKKIKESFWLIQGVIHMKDFFDLHEKILDVKNFKEDKKNLPLLKVFNFY